MYRGRHLTSAGVLILPVPAARRAAEWVKPQ
jgi:hypothetical protein